MRISPTWEEDHALPPPIHNLCPTLLPLPPRLPHAKSSRKRCRILAASSMQSEICKSTSKKWPEIRHWTQSSGASLKTHDTVCISRQLWWETGNLLLTFPMVPPDHLSLSLGADAFLTPFMDSGIREWRGRDRRSRRSSFGLHSSRTFQSGLESVLSVNVPKLLDTRFLPSASSQFRQNVSTMSTWIW